MKTLTVILVAGFALLHAGAQTSTQPAAASKKPAYIQPAPPVPDIMKPKNKLERLNTAQRGAAFHPQAPVTQLPDFALADRTGKAASMRAAAHSGHWLLIYRRDACLPCDRLMNTLAASRLPSLQGGSPFVIVVEGKKPSAAEAVSSNFTTMDGAAWMSDSSAHLRTALKPRGSPMIYALDGNRIVWQIAGTLGSPERIEKMAADWAATTSPGQSAPITPPQGSTPATAPNSQHN